MAEMNTERARFNMIEQQIRPWDVIDQRVLDLLSEVPRENFVPQQYRHLAFADMNIPIGHEQVMMAPKLEARMLQALDIQPYETVLEIGTGSAYVTALLARLAKQVYSVEIIPEFIKAAQAKLAHHGIQNVTLEEGDAAQGWPLDAPYDVVAVTGSVPLLLNSFKEILNIGGRMFIIVGDSPSMDVKLITRRGEFDWSEESLFETDLPPLINAVEPDRFEL